LENVVENFEERSRLILDYNACVVIVVVEDIMHFINITGIFLVFILPLVNILCHLVETNLCPTIENFITVIQCVFVWYYETPTSRLPAGAT
jgi:hypothetical protein